MLILDHNKALQTLAWQVHGDLAISTLQPITVYICIYFISGQLSAIPIAQQKCATTVQLMLYLECVHRNSLWLYRSFIVVLLLYYSHCNEAGDFLLLIDI